MKLPLKLGEIKLIYLDNAATTYPKPECVYSFADKFYRENGVYQGRGNYTMSHKVGSLIEENRKLILELFNAPNNYKTIFTFSSTIAINTILNGLDFKDGMNIYISPFEYNAIIRTLTHISLNM